MKFPLHLRHEVDKFKRRLILAVLRKFDYNRAAAARFLQMNRTTLVEICSQLGISMNEAPERHPPKKRRCKRCGVIAVRGYRCNCGGTNSEILSE